MSKTTGFDGNGVNLEKNTLILNECDPIVCFLVLVSMNSPESQEFALCLCLTCAT